MVARQGGSLSLVTIGSNFSPPDIDYAWSEEGYDGQFGYYISRDPSHAEPWIDIPAYRFQRILLPAIGILLSFGQESLIPWAFLLINLIALAGGMAILGRILEEYRLSQWYAIGYGLALGVFGSVRLSTTEPLAYSLVLVGIYLVRKDRWKWGAFAFALAALSKETTLLFVGAYGLYWLYQREFWKAIFFGIISILPFVNLATGFVGMVWSVWGRFGR